VCRCRADNDDDNGNLFGDFSFEKFMQISGRSHCLVAMNGKERPSMKYGEDVRQYANWPMSFFFFFFFTILSLLDGGATVPFMEGTTQQPAATDLYIDLVIDYCIHLHIGRASFLVCGLFEINDRAVCA
jgi:hypothetical protein